MSPSLNFLHPAIAPMQCVALGMPSTVPEQPPALGLSTELLLSLVRLSFHLRLTQTLQ